MKKNNWKKYTYEFLSVFFAVVFAFLLQSWHEKRKEHKAESKILSEILNGLEKDLGDAKENRKGHEIGIIANHYWRDVLENKPVDFDSIGNMYISLTRDFITIQNNSGYETLKSKGL